MHDKADGKAEICAGSDLVPNFLSQLHNDAESKWSLRLNEISIDSTYAQEVDSHELISSCTAPPIATADTQWLLRGKCPAPHNSSH